MKSLRILAVITLLLIVFSILPFPPAHAQTAGSTIAVTSAENAGPGTLRQALETAQPGDTITFDPAVFPLDNPRVISLTQELPPIQRGSITIDASGAGVILDGARINVEISTDLDDIQFSINGEVLISSDFTRGTDDWQPEDPSRADQWLVWNPEEGADTPGSLNIGNRPTGNRLITYHDPVAGKMWFEFYAADSSTWFHINPGDQLELRYTYKGAAHSAAFAYRDTERDDTFSFGDQWMPESKTWQPVALNAVVPEGAALIFPMFQPENPYHGAGLFLASDNNIIRGLTIRNFNAAIVLQGNDNLIGSDTSVTASTCAEGCNLLSGYFSGIQIEGDRNRVSGNQISARARDEHHTVWVNAVYLSGASTGTIIEKNVITFEHSDDLERIETGVFIGNEAVDARIGPNNLIQGPTQFGVAINSSSALVENNEIIDTGNCGIFLHQTRAVVITANWIGERKDGSPAESQFGVCLNGAEETQIGPDNVIAHNEFHAIDLGNAPRATITRNILRDNQRGSIVNWSPAGDEPAPPEIITVSTTTLTVVGNAEAGAMIEIYFGEGEEYAVSCEANQRGRFHCTIPREQFRADASITATASRDGGSTSTFAESYLIHAPVVTSLTGITSPLNLPNDPQVIGISLGIAVLLFVCFNLLANMSTDWINDILEGDSSLLKKAVNWIEKVMIIETGKNRLRFYLLWGAIIIGTAVAQSQLEDHPLFSIEQLKLTALLFLVTLILSVVEIGSEWLARGKWKVERTLSGKIDFRALLLVVFSVFFSRWVHFSPGIVIGIIGLVYFLPDLNARRKGPAVLVVLSAIFAVSMGFWGLSALVVGRMPVLETVFLTVFFFGVQAVFFNLIPYESSAGKEIYDWQPKAWWAFGILCGAVFVIMVFMPAFTDVDAMRQNDYTTLYIIGGSLLLLTALLAAASRWRWFEVKPKEKGSSPAVSEE